MSTKKTITQAASLALAGLLGLAGQSLLVDAPAQREPAATAQASAAVSARPARGELSLEPSAGIPTALSVKVGQTWTYELRASHAAESAAAGEPLAVRGHVQVACYQAGPDGYLLGERYRLIALDAQHAALAKSASTEVLLRVDPRGRLLELALPTDAGPDARNLLRALTITRRVELPAEARAQWSAQGEDSTGAFRAVYVARAGAQVEIARTRSYVKLHHELPNGKVSLTGKLSGTLRADGRLEAWGGTERTAVALSGADALAVRADYAFKLSSEGFLSDVSDALARAQDALGPAAWSQAIAGELGSVRREAALPPLEDLVDELGVAARLESQGFSKVAPGLFVQLRQHFLRDPQAVARAATQVSTNHLDLKVRATVIDALGSAGTPEAQRALLRLRDLVEEDLLLSVYIGLGEAREPLPEVVDSLTSEGVEEGPRRDHARRAMGWLASHASSGEVRSKLAQELELSLGETQGEDQVILEALGNAGQERSLRAITSYLNSKDEHLRASATGALRKLPGQEPETRLVELAQQDPSYRVRREAVRALAARPLSPASLQTVARILRGEAETQVKLEALEAVSTWREDAEGDAAETLDRLLKDAQNASDASLREAAAQLAG